MNIGGIGLACFTWDSDGDGQDDLFGHDGSTIGQAAWLRYHPGSNTAIALLTNGGNGRAVYQNLFNEILQEETGHSLPASPAPHEGWREKTAHLVGRYHRLAENLTVSEGDKGELLCRHTPAAEYAVLNGERTITLTPAGNSVFLGTAEGMTVPQTYHFLNAKGEPVAAGDPPAYLHYGTRAHARQSAECHGEE